MFKPPFFSPCPRLNPSSQQEVDASGSRQLNWSKRPWQWILMGCITLPIQLPFPAPFVCKPKPPTAPKVDRRRPIPAEESYPPIPEDPVYDPSPSGQSPGSLTQMSEQVHIEINDIRRSNGLRPLRWHSGLANVARQHSENMAANNFFSHTDRRGETALERTQRAGIDFRLVAENLAWSDGAPDPVEISVQGWMKSPGHRQNILRPEVTDAGVGTSRQGNAIYFTQVFIRRP